MTESYISYHAAHSEVTVNWHQLSWLSANLKAAGNVSWKNKDEISAEHNLLKNGYYSISLDFYPMSKLRIYADFSQTAFELDKGHYAQWAFMFFFYIGIICTAVITIAIIGRYCDWF